MVQAHISGNQLAQDTSPHRESLTRTSSTLQTCMAQFSLTVGSALQLSWCNRGCNIWKQPKLSILHCWQAHSQMMQRRYWHQLCEERFLLFSLVLLAHDLLLPRGWQFGLSSFVHN